MENIPIEDGGGPSSHLAVRFETPEGEGTPGVAVLYLHGFGSRQTGTKAEFFRRRFLDRGLAFCSFDFQGHGESGGSMFDLTLSRNLADVERVHALLAERGYPAIVLMGSSMGGGSALWYAARRPDDVAAAIHIAPSVALREGMLDRVGPDNAGRWEREGKLLLESEIASVEIGWGLIEDLGEYRVERLCELYRTPSLIFQGKHDTSVPWRKVLDFVVGCGYEEIDLHLMAGADHRMIDRLDHLWRLVDAFLTTRGLVS